MQIISEGAAKIRQELTLLFMEQDNQKREYLEGLSETKRADNPYDWEKRQHCVAYMMNIWGDVCDHLQERCNVDPAFNAKVMSPYKKLSGLFSYLTNKAKDYCVNPQIAMVRDADVYNWAVDFYDEDNLKDLEEAAAKKAKEEAERKRKAEEAKAKKRGRKTKKSTKKKETVTPEVEKKKTPIMEEMKAAYNADVNLPTKTEQQLPKPLDAAAHAKAQELAKKALKEGGEQLSLFDLI